MKFTRASIHWVLPSITTDFTCDVTAPTIGIIMAAAAVLLIHMDKNQVGIMRPNINLEGTEQFLILLFESFNIFKYKLSCNRSV